MELLRANAAVHGLIMIAEEKPPVKGSLAGVRKGENKKVT